MNALLILFIFAVLFAFWKSSTTLKIKRSKQLKRLRIRVNQNGKIITNYR